MVLPNCCIRVEISELLISVSIYLYDDRAEMDEPIYCFLWRVFIHYAIDIHDVGVV